MMSLLFIPVLCCTIYAIYFQYRRHELVGLVTLTAVGVVTITRMFLLSLDFSDHLPDSLRWLETLTMLYIVPTMYMFLCDQCGTKWNNKEATIMVILPIFALFGSPIIDIGGDHDQAYQNIVKHSFNIFIKGEPFLTISIPALIAAVQCTIVGFCMVRLWERVKKYGLKFNSRMVFYYVWMFCMLISFAIGHLLELDTFKHPEAHTVYYLVFVVQICIGFVFVPYSFHVAPIVTVEEEKPVQLDNFVEQNAHLADHLHQLMEEDRIYLRQSLHIDDLAAMMGTNRTYVTRLMRTEFGQTFTDYVNNARVIYSKKLLLTSSMSLDEVALASGFPSSPAYCRVFKRITGTTPIAWKTEQVDI